MSIFNLRQFDFADVVSNLLQPKELRVTFFINDRLPSEDVFECGVKDGRYLVLPVVVIDFDSVIALETLKSVEQKRIKSRRILANIVASLLNLFLW